MRFTLSWLLSFLESDASVEDLSHSMTMIGLEVESMHNPGDRLADFLIAEVTEVSPHPDADRLSVCQVNNGNEILQIVCGAPNVRPNMKVVLASVGVTIPTNEMVIKAASIRGVSSSGMLCSASELGLGNDHEGIMELAQDATVGESFVAYSGLDDPVFEIAITPNRGDCLGVYGIARDLAAAGRGRLKPLTIPNITPKRSSDRTITIEADNACRYFLGCEVTGVTNGESPAWLKQRLSQVGTTPINALVDITNYIALSFARPLHVYDQAKIGKHIKVRSSTEQETIEALDHKSYRLDKNMVVVADENHAIAIAGIIGGKESGCSVDTKDILLEVALFDPITVAKMGRKLDIHTDSRQRFERGVDGAFVEESAQLALGLITEICGGEVIALISAGQKDAQRAPIRFDPHYVNQLGGISLTENRIKQILQDLDFTVDTSQKPWSVMVPTHRNDVEGEADLVEEVLRIHGYDTIPSIALPSRRVSSGMTAIQERRFKLRRKAAELGLTEVITWSFMHHENAPLFLEEEQLVHLANPISSELDIMRPSILPNLLEVVVKNSLRDRKDLAIFESGPIYKGVEPEDESHTITCLRVGRIVPKSHYMSDREVDIFDSKADLLGMLAFIGLKESNLTIQRNAPSYYHPGQSGAVYLGKQLLGYFGKLHPSVLKHFDIGQDVVACELFTASLPKKRKSSSTKASLSLSDYQEVVRDFAFVVSNDVDAAALLSTIQNVDKQLIQKVVLFDLYQGEHLQEGQKSLALSVTLQSLVKTLEEADITEVSQQIIAAAVKYYGAELRS